MAESRDKLASGPGVALNYVVAPRGADVYVRGSTAENKMFISGRQAGHRRDIKSSNDLGVPTTRLGMSLKTDPEEPAYDPQFQNVQIGGFARMEYKTPPLYTKAPCWIWTQIDVMSCSLMNIGTTGSVSVSRVP